MEVKKRRFEPNIISPQGVVYGGLDESNHGRFPEYFSLVLSGKERDSIKLTLGKAITNNNLRNIFKRVARRGHTFLQAEQVDYDRIIPFKFIGYVSASLCEDFLPKDLNLFKLFIDGKLETPKRIYLRDLIADIYGFSKRQVEIQAGGKYDKKYPIVNMADGISRHYFRKKFSAKELSMNPHRRELHYFD